MGVMSFSKLKNKKAAMGLSLLTGVLSRVGISAGDIASSESKKYSLKQGVKDVARGAVIGILGPIGRLKKSLSDKLYLKMVQFFLMNIITSGPYAFITKILDSQRPIIQANPLYQPFLGKKNDTTDSTQSTQTPLSKSAIFITKLLKWVE